MKAILIATLALLLCACATSKPVQGPNGGTAYFIKCPAGAVDFCYEEAAKVCPSGYTLADKQGPGFMRSPNTLLVECKPQG